MAGSQVLARPSRVVARPRAGAPPGRPGLAEAAFVGLLAATIAALAVRLVAGGWAGELLTLLRAHAGLLAAELGVVALLRRRPDARWAEPLRVLSVVALLGVCYESVGYAGFAAVPWTADGALAALDRALLGGPAAGLLGPVSPRALDGWSAVYAGYLPYLYLSILVASVARPRRERRAVLAGLALLYAASYVGYLLLPAHGPLVAEAAALPPLAGGAVHRAIVVATAATGGVHGAFPSLHVGATVYLALFDWRRGRRLRALAYAPLVLLLVPATLVLRYHYGVDLLAGAALAVVAERVAWRAARPEVGA
jgi:hypothetical protein